MKKVLAIAVLATIGAAVNAAPIDCSTVSTYQQLLDSNNNPEPGCQDQDKIYSNWGGTVPGGTAVSISSVLGAVDQHSVTFGDLGFGATYDLSYVIEIEPTPANVNRWITQVDLDTDAAAGSGSATKVIYAWNGAQGVLLDTLVSSNGIPDSSVPIHEKALLINETFSVVTSAYNSSTNVFYQSVDAIPEPGTYALMGIGLIGLGILSRYRSKRTPQ